MQNISRQVLKAQFYAAFVFVIVVGAIFLNFCFGFYCYCNFVKPPLSYVCKGPLFFDRDSQYAQTLTTTTCNVFTFGMYKYYVRLFEGLSSELQTFSTAIGSMCDVGYLTTAVVIVVLPYFRRRPGIVFADVDTAFRNTQQTLSENFEEMTQTQNDIKTKQAQMVQLLQGQQQYQVSQGAYHQQALNEVNILLNKNSKLQKQIFKYQDAHHKMRKELALAQQEALDYRIQVRNILKNLQAPQQVRPLPVNDNWLLDHQRKQRGRRRDRTPEHSREMVRSYSVAQIPLSKATVRSQNTYDLQRIRSRSKPKIQ